MQSAFVRIISLVLSLVVSQAAASPLFESDSILQVSLSGPLTSMIERSDDTVDTPFLLRVDGAELPIQVQIRGKSRRHICDFPPLRFTFTPGAAENTVFSDQTKIKFVSHCKDNDASQIDTIEEFAVYKMFSLLSDASYKVRLLRINYGDTDGSAGDANAERFGFLIEPAAKLADRLGASKVDTEGLKLSTLNANQAATVYIFQYLIGNTDWSLVMADEDDKCCHNGDLFRNDEKLFYVPYDFDMSGFVNARYAKPDPALRITKVTRRRYRGYCIDTAALKDALIAIKSRQDEILGVVHQLPVLSQKDKDRKVRFLEGFFKLAADEDKLIKSFDRNCL